MITAVELLTALMSKSELNGNEIKMNKAALHN
jgi:hypothetical protein